jgi:Uma2 family endonuclease
MTEIIVAPNRVDGADNGVKMSSTQAELPYDDGIPMETPRHKFQMEMLIDTLFPWISQRPDGFVNGNMFVYYSPEQVKNEDFRGPDLFVVLGVPKTERLSWVVWEEGKQPDLVIELLSESTKVKDKNQKKLIYQNSLCVPEYFWFDPFNAEDWAGFYLNGEVYQQISPNSQNQLVSRALGLALVRWEGFYREINATWLRWSTLDGELLPTSQEFIQQEKQQVEQEKQRAEQAESQLRGLATNLLQTGMSLEQVANLMDITVSQLEEIVS